MNAPLAGKVTTIRAVMRDKRPAAFRPFADIHTVERLCAVRRAGAKPYSRSIDFSARLM
jgi:hypothetical protein